METNMTTEKALDILERHNFWRRGADCVEATDPKLLGIALDKAIEVLRLSNVVGQSELLIAFLDYADPIYWGENECTDRRQLIDEFLKSKQ